jgi:hypothetical protein
MAKELTYLRDKRWEVERNVRKNYDFGMISLDCVNFKLRLIDHILGVINHLENYIRTDFTTK